MTMKLSTVRTTSLCVALVISLFEVHTYHEYCRRLLAANRRLMEASNGLMQADNELKRQAAELRGADLLLKAKDAELKYQCARLRMNAETLMRVCTAEEDPTTAPGWIDLVDEQGDLWGWAWNPAAPAERVKVQVKTCGKVVAEAVAADYREDLEAAGVGDGKHSFHIPHVDWPQGCRLRVKATVGGKQVQLYGSPLERSQ